ncbi:MAG: hypothetical protein A2W00_03760 [Candidatus Eisenbacteria bacterium RBG_16_71_46]|nr:MAG: hypothetical protein A2W00_03760 [Candidatus Eisenbacteria bacterium RBG_16_71_46]
MKFHHRITATLALLGLCAAAPLAQAQMVNRDMVQRELELTDRRIEQAQMVVSGSDNQQAGAELALAVDLQANARGRHANLEFAMALKMTVAARTHADRAIAMIRNLPDPERVLAQLERTRDLLERARERIEECDNDRARAMLRVAFDMQERAEDAARNSRYLIALQMTVSARERGLKALRICKMEDNLKDAAERALRRTDQVIGRAQDVLAEKDNEQARQALGHAIELQARAQSEFGAGHFEASLRLTEAARVAAHRAIRFTDRR